MKAILIHLSDSHLRTDHKAVANHHAEIAATIRPVIVGADSVFVVWTGDIVYAGTAEEYLIAEQFLERLKAEIRRDFAGPIEVVLTPGNHDGVFKTAKATRQGVIDQIRQDSSKASNQDYIAACVEPMEHFFAFQNRVASNGVTYSHQLLRDYRFQIGEKTLRFSAMNASWMTVPKVHIPLTFPTDMFLETYEQSETVNILLIHHPLNWYAQDTYHPLRRMVQFNYQVVMSGHEHNGNANIVTDFKDRSVVMLEGPALDPTKGGAFSVAVLDMDGLTIASETFKWKGQYYEAENGAAYWDNRKLIPTLRPHNGFHLTENAKKMLGSLDASFQHPNKEHLQLSDVFVYPELQDISSENVNDEPKSADCLLSNDQQCNRALVFGDEQFGKTSLLKHLFLELHQAGCIPLILNATEADGNHEQFLRMLHRKVEEFYGPEATTRFSQAKFEDKVVLVDDLDCVGTRGDVIARVLKNLESQFGKVIITAGERYEMTIVQSQEAVNATDPYTQFKMLGFGYKLRYDLIRRWYAVGADSQAEFQERVFGAEQIINTVLGKGLVPMTAFNTLVLLQSIEINENRSLVNAGMAQYYEFMLRQSLMSVKVQAGDYDEIQNFLTHLAWTMYENHAKEIDIHDLTIFNRKYSDEFFRADLTPRLELLEKARILVKVGDKYTLAYSYLDYFFVAKYMALYCDEQPEIRERIKHLCNHLYLKENANIVLFITYNLHANWVIQEIANVLNLILADVPVLQISTDANLLNSWISNQAKLVVDTTDMVANNRRMKDADDTDANRLPEPIHDHEVSSISELDQLAQINLLFKTCEILGQVLKGRYGSIKNPVKEELMKRLFDAPLRGVSFFHQLVNDEPEGLLRELSLRLHKNQPNRTPEKAENVAKKFLFRMMGAITDSFFSRQGEIIGSAKLIDTIDKVAASSGEVTYQIVGVAAKLSIPNHAPTEEVRKLAESLKKNYFGHNLVQGLVARHLYMFHLPVAERNSLAAAVGIAVRDQRGIEMRSQTTKKLPGKMAKPRHSKSLIAKLRDSFIMNNPKVQMDEGQNKKRET